MKSENRITIRNSIATKLLRVVFSLYLVISISVTLGHMVMEYHYQKNNISHDLKDIQKTFEQSLAIDIWQLNQESLLSTIEGMLEIPVIVGVKVQDVKGLNLAVGGIITQSDAVGNVGRHVNLLGLNKEECEVHQDEIYKFDVFMHQFPIIYTYAEETRQLGNATIYSNSSVVFRRVRLEFLLLVANAVIKTMALWFIFLWFSNFLLRKPLASLASATEDVSLDNLDSFRVKIETSGRNELKILEESFNIMIGNLHQSMVERDHTEEELHRLRRYLSNIINSMPSILIGVDTDGMVTQWNREAQRVTGISVKDAVGQPLTKAFPRLSAEAERVRQAMQSRQTLSAHKQARQEDGETRYEDMTVYPLTANGVEGAVIRIDDVTEKVRMEEMMIQSEKMLSVGGLAAGMAHEINNPLAGMMQTADNMSNRLTNMNLPANLRAAQATGVSMEAVRVFMESRGIPRMIATICESGRRIAEIVDNMLSFARKSDSSVSTHNMASLLDKTLQLASTDYDLKKRYDFKAINIEKQYENSLPLVPCEGAKIQQVLLNILSNGAQAMQTAGAEKPKFVLRTRFEKERKTVCIEIEDNGPGIDEAVRKHIFEPFFTTKPVGEGTGLGLSVSYFIITENHGGELSVESQPGSGAKFIIRLPSIEYINRKEIEDE